MRYLKENQGRLYEDVRLLFGDLESSAYHAYTYVHTRAVDKGHGRIELRESWSISEPEALCHLRGFENWTNLRAVSRIRAERRTGVDISCEDRYYIASICSAKRILSNVRFHTGVSRTSCIGSWILPLMKTTTACGKNTARKTSLLCVTSS